MSADETLRYVEFETILQRWRPDMELPSYHICLILRSLQLQLLTLLGHPSYRSLDWLANGLTRPLERKAQILTKPPIDRRRNAITNAFDAVPPAFWNEQAISSLDRDFVPNIPALILGSATPYLTI